MGLRQWLSTSQAKCSDTLQRSGYSIQTNTTNTIEPCKISSNSNSKQRIVFQSVKAMKTSYLHAHAYSDRGILIKGNSWRRNIFLSGYESVQREFEILPNEDADHGGVGTLSIDIYRSNSVIGSDVPHDELENQPYVADFGTLEVEIDLG